MTNLSRLLSHILILLIGGSLFTACFDDEEVDYSVYNDLVLTNISFGTLPRIMHTTSKAGADSTYMSTVSATSVYPFTIDQISNVAYNLDSLPVGTRADKIIFSNFTVNGGSFTLKSLSNGKDTLYAVADTLDFSKGAREFNLYGSDGTSRRTYRVEVRIHQQKPDSVTWTPRSIDEFNERYAVAPKPSTTFEAAGHFFTLDPGKAILAADNAEAEAAPETIAEADVINLPTDNSVWATMTSRADSNIEEVYLYGTRGKGEDLTAKFWRRNIDVTGSKTFAWEFLPSTTENINPIPALRCAYLAPFDKGLLLVGLDKESKICVKFSTDRGRTWKAHSALVLPKTLTDVKAEKLLSLVDADNNLWLLIDDTTVWCGRAHAVSWADDQREFVK